MIVGISLFNATYIFLIESNTHAIFSKSRFLILCKYSCKLTNSSMTGRKVYPFADYFFVQWEEMKNVYPNARYCGTVY